jgi:uncharacterized membrane protein YhaH (DUF805 family)
MATNFFSYRGRLDRAKYRGFMFAAAVLIMLWSSLIALLYALTGSESENLKAAFGFVIFAGMVACWSLLSVKRFHDLNKPGWYFCLLVVPLLNAYLAFLLFFQDGGFDPNKYGEDPTNYKTTKENTPAGTAFLTPPRWGSWRRYVALVLALTGLILSHDITFVQIRDDVEAGGFSIFDLLLLWPLILVWVGWFNFIGLWDYTHRIVIENGKATFHLLGLFGTEKQAITLDAISGINTNRVVGIANGKQMECYVKRKYLSPVLCDELMQIGKTKAA